MPVTLPQSVKKILEDKAYGHVITFDESGKPQVTMVWVDVDGDDVVARLDEHHVQPDLAESSERDQSNRGFVQGLQSDPFRFATSW